MPLAGGHFPHPLILHFNGVEAMLKLQFGQLVFDFLVHVGISGDS